MQTEDDKHSSRQAHSLSDWLAGLSPKLMREAFIWGPDLGREVVAHWEKTPIAPSAPNPGKGS